jgi:hypothetical protein
MHFFRSTEQKMQHDCLFTSVTLRREPLMAIGYQTVFAFVQDSYIVYNIAKVFDMKWYDSYRAYLYTLNLQNVQKRKKKDVIKNSKGKNDRA